MEKNCKTCKRRYNELDSICAQCVWTDDYELWEPADISPDLCCGITDSVVSQGEKRENNPNFTVKINDGFCEWEYQFALLHKCIDDVVSAIENTLNTKRKHPRMVSGVRPENRVETK